MPPRRPNPTLVSSSFLCPLLGPNSLEAYVYTYFLQFLFPPSLKPILIRLLSLPLLWNHLARHHLQVNNQSSDNQNWLKLNLYLEERSLKLNELVSNLRSFKKDLPKERRQKEMKKCLVVNLKAKLKLRELRNSDNMVKKIKEKAKIQCILEVINNFNWYI